MLLKPTVQFRHAVAVIESYIPAGHLMPVEIAIKATRMHALIIGAGAALVTFILGWECDLNLYEHSRHWHLGRLRYHLC
jgi:hypothetical protein